MRPRINTIHQRTKKKQPGWQHSKSAGQGQLAAGARLHEPEHFVPKGPRRAAAEDHGAALRMRRPWSTSHACMQHACRRAAGHMDRGPSMSASSVKGGDDVKAGPPYALPQQSASVGHASQTRHRLQHACSTVPEVSRAAVARSPPPVLQGARTTTATAVAACAAGEGARLKSAAQNSCRIACVLSTRCSAV
jgi:hypothetical protein